MRSVGIQAFSVHSHLIKGKLGKHGIKGVTCLTKNPPTPNGHNIVLHRKGREECPLGHG